MNANGIPIATPLSDDEFDEFDELLRAHSSFDTDGALGVLHAVVVAPGLLPPSTWMPIVVPNGLGDLNDRTAQQLIGFVLRLYNELLDVLEDGRTMVPDADDVAACESFAVGYAAGAELDPHWIGNAERWTFASHVAYLGGRLDLVPKETVAKIESTLPDPKAVLRRDLAGIVAAAHKSFLKFRREAFAPSKPTPARVEHVGRNEPCVCGSGKKYKRCCIDRPLTQ